MGILFSRNRENEQWLSLMNTDKDTNDANLQREIVDLKEQVNELKDSLQQFRLAMNQEIYQNNEVINNIQNDHKILLQNDKILFSAYQKKEENKNESPFQSCQGPQLQESIFD